MVLRAWLVAFALLLDITAQPLGVLRIKITIVDADGRARPVPRHALLIAKTHQRRAAAAITALDGTAEAAAAAGELHVESDELIFGRGLRMAPNAGRCSGPATVIEFTAANAQIEAAAAGSAANQSTRERRPSSSTGRAASFQSGARRSWARGS